VLDCLKLTASSLVAFGNDISAGSDDLLDPLVLAVKKMQNFIS
jgi:hypothetical protein